MRKILLLAAVWLGLFACNDEEEVSFDVPVEFRKELSFRPIPGGSVMNYYLPRNSDIFGVRVRYNDARGIPVVKEGTYLVDSLQLTGFNEAVTATASLCFFNNQMVESEPMEITFDTEDSAPVAFFDSLTISQFWGGFSLSYRTPETVSGMVHVFYLGTNPLTHEPDSILLTSTPIMPEGDTLNFQLQQKQETNTVIVRTEDYRGYRVKQEIYPDLPCLYMDTLTTADFDFEFTGDEVTNETYQFGQQYLFDGDKNGLTYHNNTTIEANPYAYATYVAGPNAFYPGISPEDNRFIVDLREPKIPASVNLYAYLNYGTFWPYNDPNFTIQYPTLLAEVWNGSYIAKLPSKVKLYGTNEDPKTVDLASCALLFELDEGSANSDWQESWAVRSDNTYGPYWDERYDAKTEAEILAADPVVLSMLCHYSGESFRYLIFVVEDTYDASNGDDSNTRQFVSFNELEVCVKAE